MYKVLLSTLFLLILSCAPKPGPASDAAEPVYEVHPSAWAPLCEHNGMYFASKKDCEDGDSSLWLGLLCISGHFASCDASKQTQDSLGKVWRSPRRVGKDTVNSSSRDMVLGFLAGLVVTKDWVATRKLVDYIENNNDKLCEDATDNRCNMTDNMWDLIDLVEGGAVVPSSYQARLQAQASFGPTGYELHLVAVQLLIIKKLGHTSEWLVNIANTLHHRQPKNQFFAALAGVRIDPLVCEQNDHMDQWSLERADDNGAWKASMGWECVFLEGLQKGI